MMQQNAHMAAAAKAEALFSCANIALIADTILVVSLFVIQVSRISLLGPISLLVIISIIICRNSHIPKDMNSSFA